MTTQDELRRKANAALNDENRAKSREVRKTLCTWSYQVVERAHERYGIPRDKGKQILTCLIETLKDRLIDGDYIILQNFGKLFIRQHHRRKYVVANKVGPMHQIQCRVCFIPSVNFRKRMHETEHLRYTIPQGEKAKNSPGNRKPNL